MSRKSRRNRVQGQRRKPGRPGLAAACSGALLSAVAATALAQQGPAPDQPEAQQSPQRSDSNVVLQEVIVTARKRDESLQNVPISISVESGEALKSQQVDAPDELYRVVPNLVLTEGQGGSNANLSLRGIGTMIVEDPQGVEPSIGMVVDGVVMGSTGGAGIMNFSDVKRVEVLRGPQGTLFGKNSSAGVVHIVTQDPTGQFSAHVGMDYSPTYNNVKTDGAISGPLVGDKLLGRLSFFTSTRDGYIKNLYDDRMVGDDRQLGVRGKLLFKPSETTKIKLTGTYISRQQPDSFELSLLREIQPTTFVLSTKYNSDLANPANDEMRGIGRTAYEDQIRSLAVQLDQGLGDFTLTSISAWAAWSFDMNPEGQLPLNEVPVPWILKDTQSAHQHQWSEEVRLASPTGGLLDYVVGLYLFDESIHRTMDALLDAQWIGIPDLYGVRGTNDHFDTLNYAGFGEANIHLSDTFTLIAGARWTHERKEFDHKVPPLAAPGGAPFFTFGPTGLPPVTDAIDASRLTWRAGIQWKPNAGQMVYATAATGFKGPTFNANASTDLPGSLLRIDPETSTSYEIGWKSDLLGHRMRTALDVFYTTLRNFQADVEETIVDPVTGQSSNIQLVRNADEIVSKGVELELEAAPTDHLRLALNGAYTDAQYTDFRNAPCYPGQTAAQGCINDFQDLSGTPLPRAARWTFNTNVDYGIPLASLPFEAFVRVEYDWRDRMPWSLTNSPDTTEGSLGLLGGSIGLRALDEHFVIRAYGKNLTNKFHTIGIVDPGGNMYLNPDYRRIWGVSFSYDF